MPESLPFCVYRPCEHGRCPASDGACDCDPWTPVDVDELVPPERAHFQQHGTPAQKELIAVYYEEPADREAELLAGQRDPFPELQ